MKPKFITPPIIIFEWSLKYHIIEYTKAVIYYSPGCYDSLLFYHFYSSCPLQVHIPQPITFLRTHKNLFDKCESLDHTYRFLWTPAILEIIRWLYTSLWLWKYKMSSYRITVFKGASLHLTIIPYSWSHTGLCFMSVDPPK